MIILCRTYSGPVELDNRLPFCLTSATAATRLALFGFGEWIAECQVCALYNKRNSRIARIYKVGQKSKPLRGGATLCDEFEEHAINGCVQNKTTLKCAENHENRSRNFEAYEQM